MGRFGKILAVRLSSAGDVLQTLPAIGVLRARLPGSHVAFLVEERNRAFVENRPEIDEIISWPGRRWFTEGRSSGPVAAARSALSFYAGLAGRSFDAVLDFQGNFKSGFHTMIARAPLKAGFASSSSKEMNTLFTNLRVAPRAERGLRTRKYVDLLSAIGIEGSEPRAVPPPAGAVEVFRRLFPASALPDRGFFVVHPGTSGFGAYKRWPADRWAALVKNLVAEAPVLVSAGPGEEALALSLCGPTGVVAHRGPLGVPELAGALSLARAFCGSDSAPLHLAHALCCPAVGLFGPTDPRLYGPFGPGEALKSGVPCSPCRRRTCADPACMASIEEDAVRSAIMRCAR